MLSIYKTITLYSGRFFKGLQTTQAQVTALLNQYIQLSIIMLIHPRKLHHDDFHINRAASMELICSHIPGHPYLSRSHQRVRALLTGSCHWRWISSCWQGAPLQMVPKCFLLVSCGSRLICVVDGRTNPSILQARTPRSFRHLRDSLHRPAECQLNQQHTRTECCMH